MQNLIFLLNIRNFYQNFKLLFNMKNNTQKISKIDYSFRIKKLQKSKLFRELKNLRKNKSSVEQFQNLTTLTKSSVEYLKEMQNDLQEEEIQKLLLILNANLKQHKSYFVKKAQFSQFYRKIDPSTLIETKKITEKMHIDWLNLPKHLIPELMNMATFQFFQSKCYKQVFHRLKHSARKRLQISYIIQLLKHFLEKVTDNFHIIDFGGGRGDLTLLLAYFFPKVRVTCLDVKRQSLQQVFYRAQQLKLTNVSIFEGRIQDFTGDFDLALGLHCCGALTDIILGKCYEQKKDFFLVTCCFGKIRNMGIEKDQDFWDICDLAECESFMLNLNQQNNSVNKLDADMKTLFDNGQEKTNNSFEGDNFLKHIQIQKPDLKEIKDLNQKVAYDAKRFINSERLSPFLKHPERYACQILEIPKECSLKNQILVSQKLAQFND